MKEIISGYMDEGACESGPRPKRIEITIEEKNFNDLGSAVLEMIKQRVIEVIRIPKGDNQNKEQLVRLIFGVEKISATVMMDGKPTDIELPLRNLFYNAAN